MMIDPAAIDKIDMKFANAKRDSAHAATKYLMEMAEEIRLRAYKNASSAYHEPLKPHVAGTGPGPNYASSMLRDHIVVEPLEVGKILYTAKIGMEANITATYAPAGFEPGKISKIGLYLETGVTGFAPGVKFPFLKPAFDTVVKTWVGDSIFNKFFGTKIFKGF